MWINGGFMEGGLCYYFSWKEIKAIRKIKNMEREILTREKWKEKKKSRVFSWKY